MTDAPMESKPAVLDEVQYAGPAAPPLPAITEQPELVAQGICQFADTVGRERVIAGTDCGFGTFAGYGKIDPDIAFKKLGAMVEGAAIASKRLWGRA